MTANQPLLNSISPISESSEPAIGGFGSSGGHCQPASFSSLGSEGSDSVCLNIEEEEEADLLKRRFI